MQYEAKNPKEYLDLIENDWRKEKLENIRITIKSYAPELQESIQYKMLCYGNDDFKLFHLNVQKAYVSLYVGNIDKIENARDLLNGLDLGKGCIRVKKNVNILETGLDAFIKRTVDIWRDGGDTHC